MFSSKSRKIVRDYEKRLIEQTAPGEHGGDGKQPDPGKSGKGSREEFLRSQIGEEENFFTMLRRLVKENKLAVFSQFEQGVSVVRNDMPLRQALVARPAHGHA